MEYVGNIMNIVEGVRNFESIDEEMDKLKRKSECLKSREEDIEKELQYAERLSSKKRRKVVENWLTNVGRIKNGVEEMEQEVRERRWHSHFQLQQKMGRLTEQVAELIQQGGFPEGLTLEAHGNEQIELVTTKLIGQTFQKNKNVLLKYLMSDKVSIIGIYGMGGVGKTTLVTRIHNQLCNRPNSSVSWVTVSQNFRIHKLQSDIAKTIGLQLENDGDERRRAAKLARGLREKENFVLILDDVWQNFSLDRVGIPTGGNGCKLILTSRSLEVCRKIGCKEYIKVEPLTEKEAWELFTEKLGHDKTLSPQIKPIAKSLTKKCSGLPLGIITMAGCMREVEDINEWSDALEKMEESVAEHDDDMGIEVFQVLKYSYDMLKDQKLQKCFLYCSLFPEDYEINRETLVEYFIDERLVDEMRSRQAELNRGHTILNKLENVCLLIGGVKDGESYVKMHDLVRSMAIQIARVDSRFLVEAGEGLREIPGEVKWAEDLTKVSLMLNSISYIPSNASPKCPRLSTLMLNYNRYLRSISDCFFSHMFELSVLDLSYTEIGNLPSSISDLVNLTALWLEGCESLKYVPSLAKLKALKKLNLSRTRIREVPQGLEMLFNLRYLNLDSTALRMIPNGILPKLSCLQYLVTHGSDILSSKVRGKEIVQLRKLETFKGQLYDIDDFNTYARCRDNVGGPNNYLLLVGQYFISLLYTSFVPNCDRAVYLNLCKISKSKAGEDSLVLPKDIQYLYIQQCDDVSSLCDIASLKNATQLSKCYIDHCYGIEHVICSCSCSLPLIHSLESLRLEYLLELSASIGLEICCASSNLLQTSMFSSLKEFVIIQCPKIKRLFTPVLLSHLKNIEVMRVEYCEQMVEIIEASDEDDENQVPRNSIIFTLPKLRVLWLVCLPELERFCTREIVFDSLKEIYTDGCPKLSFNGQHVKPDSLEVRYPVFKSHILQHDI